MAGDMRHENAAAAPVTTLECALLPASPVGIQHYPALPSPACAPSAYDTVMEPMIMLTTSFMLAPAPTSPAAQGG